ncbi:MAG: LamG-like jellyroll fold domain-containing protein [Bacteroidota bacterium]
MKRTKTITAHTILTALLLLVAAVSFGQPDRIIKLSDDKCEGRVKFKFIGGKEVKGVFDDDEFNIDNSKLMIQFDGENAQEIMYFESGDCTPQVFSLPMPGADVTLDACKRGTPYGLDITKAEVSKDGENYFIEITIDNLGNIRTQKAFEIYLDYKWYENDDDLIRSGNTAAARYERHQPISSITTTATRETCLPERVTITARANVKCNKSGYKYRLTIEKDDNPNFSSPETLLENKDFTSNSGTIIDSLTDVTTASAYYRSILKYVKNGSSNIFQEQTSIVAPVQTFSVAPPVLREVSKTDCDNRINLKWQYSSSQASKFEIYRSSFAIRSLRFDGNRDFLTVSNSGNIFTSSSISFETRVKLTNLNQNNIFYNSGNFDIYTGSSGKLTASVGGTSVTSTNPLPINSWIHIAIVYDYPSGDLSLYLNGEKDTSTSVSSAISSNTNPIIIGAYTNSDYDFKGEIADVRIWKKALTSIEPNSSISGTESDLLLYYDFQDGEPNGNNQSVTMLEDRSPNSFDAQLNGFALQGQESNFNLTYGGYASIGTVDGNIFEYTDSESIESNQLYSYYLTATKTTCSSNEETSLPSNTVDGFSPTVPNAPSALVVTVDSEDNRIVLDWDDNADDETGYSIKRRFGDAQTIFSAAANDTLYEDLAIIACRSYVYDVFAENDCGPSNGAAVGEARLEPDLSETLQASRVSASKGKFSNRVELNWTPQNNTGNLIDRYRVFRKTLGSTDSTQIDVVSGNTNIYRDATAEPGIIYEYTLVGEADCDGDVLQSNVVTTVGYRTATGLVNGQITYSGSNAVEGVKVMVVAADNSQIGKSLQLDGVDDKVTFDSLDLNGESFTIELWTKRDALGEVTLLAHGDTGIVNHQNLFIGFNTSNNFQFNFGGDVLTTTDDFTDLVWEHWSCVYDATNNERLIYRNDSLVAMDQPTATYQGNGDWQLGAKLGATTTSHFQGQIDEMRIWSIAKDSASVVKDYNRILNGNEANLTAMYSFDEGIGNGIYDRSRAGFLYNERHGNILGTANLSAAWSMDIPDSDQLSLHALTDENGNYSITAIPYAGSGLIYKVVPQLGTHQFEPSQTSLFIGSRSDVFNGTNFIDISSFPVTGTVFYQGTSCPADQIEIQIDGVTAKVNGENVTTNNQGAFTVDVPIGRHRISLFKEGHEFAVGQFPTNGSLFDFQEPLSGLEFLDSTKLDIIGRVVGGTAEGNKVPGLGRSKNNIGQARIVFESLVGNGCHKDTVFTNATTGEYLTQLYPLKYVVKDVRVIHPSQNISTQDFFDALPQIDLVNSGQTLTAKDTIRSGDGTITQIDSVQYNHKEDFIYRSTAVVNVFNSDGSYPIVGETQNTFTDSTGMETSFDLSTLRYPVFKRAHEYQLLVKTFELYENYDDGAAPVRDSVPVTDGRLIVNNLLADDANRSLEIDITDGDTLLSFRGGRPNLLTNDNTPQYNFTRTLDITLQRSGQAEDVKWEPFDGESLEERIFRGYLLGFELIQGSNFVTRGPQVVKAVIRDPVGDGSTASWAKGTTKSFTTTWTTDQGASNKLDNTVKAGAEISIGAGVSTTTTAVTETTTNFQLDINVGTSDAWTESLTTLETITTNGNEEAVGTRSDIYIGDAFNVEFGVTKDLQFVPTEICETSGLPCQLLFVPKTGCANPNAPCQDTLPFQIAQRTGFIIAPSSTAKTYFIYDQNFLVNYLIPNLKTIRNSFFTQDNSNFVSHVASDDEEKYGTNNDDTVWDLDVSTDTPDKTELADSTGMSYSWVGEEPYEFKFDSIRIFNQQIKLWENAIARNERDKRDAINDPSTYRERNISLNGGVSFASETETTIEEEDEFSFEIGIEKEFELAIKGEVGGSGGKTSLNTTISQTTNRTTTDLSSNTTVWAYEIVDDDQGDFHNIEIYKSPLGWGPIFRTIAGQTSCPHEEGDSTLYYRPGRQAQVLNERTLQRDKVAIDIFPKLVQNVPEGEAATFNVQFQNISETNDARFYAVRVDPSSNPDGLSVNMDGETITVENEFAMPGGAVQTKVITVERGPEKYEYNNIRLLFYAPCQYEAGTADEIDIVDTVTFSVTFLPECTDVRLKEPNDLWVVNNFNLDTLPITIDNYDINKNGFESISLQYKPASESVWRELNKWWHPTNTSEPGDQIPTNSSFIRYDWDMSSNTDGPYQLRVVSGCELVNKETEFKQGTADRINPIPFGTPSPGDGILDPGEDLQIRFNEPIDIGSLTSLNFDVRGVLNGTELRHSESINFDGANDYATIQGYDLTKRSLAVEFWAKLDAGSNGGTVFSQGSEAVADLVVGFDASNKFMLQLGSETITTDNAVPLDEWKHFVANYDYESGAASLLIDGVEVKVDNSFNVEYNGTGDIQLGRTTASANEYLEGNLHELRLWSKTRSAIDVVPTFNISLSPTTAGLIGYWQMNEGIGTIAEDRVRMRNAQLSGATWTILPVGQSFTFDGVDDYLEVQNTGTLVLTNEADLTLEMWFKGTSAGTLFSNGRGEKSVSDSTSWVIGLNADGKVVVQNNGETFEDDNGGLLDDNWHHLAVVLRRNSSISLYVDGELRKVGDSRIWSSYAASKLWIGARGWIAGVTEMRDQYFDGQIDDVRLWNLARRPEQIARDWVNRLNGDELGLMAYYPFESYELDAGVPVLMPSLKDQSMNEYDLSQGGSTALNYTMSTPPIKLQRPVQKVNFTYAVNEDEIILTPTDPSGRLEHVTLDVTVRNVKDKFGNILPSPATWIAFVNKNQVLWDRDELELGQTAGESMTFEALIVNTGGSQENYEIMNLPSWLTASPASGSIAPNSNKKVTFTIADGVNIGTYEQDILLSTDFGFNERLVLKLKVAAEEPEWNINSAMFLHSMSYVGELVIENVVSIDVEDRLAVFVDNELRGVANVELDPVTERYLVYLDVFSNEVQNEDLEFRIWDASEGKVHKPVTPTDYTFQLHGFVGTPQNPQVFEAVSSIEQAYTLEAGWNWISFPLASSTLSDVDETFKYLDATEGDRVLSQSYFDTYTESDGWSGALTFAGNGFNRKELYKVFVAEAGTFNYSGTLGNPNDVIIPISTGWNWIGFVSDKNVPLNTALATLNPADGDVIKGQRTFAVYQTGLGWTGSLDFLEPTKGYMLYSTNAGTLRYPASSGVRQTDAQLKSANRLIALEHELDLRVQDHRENFSMVAEIAACPQTYIGSAAYVVAKVGGEVRGVAPIVWMKKRAMVYLTIHGYEAENIEFSLIRDAQKRELAIQEEIEFTKDQLFGVPTRPFQLTIVEHCLADNANISPIRESVTEVAIYPNPFEEQLNVDFKTPHTEQVSVTLKDVTGKTVATIFEGTLDKGIHRLQWTESQSGQLSSGVYLLHIQASSFSHVEKIIR